MQYIAKTLLYLKELVDWIDPETGDKEQRERGYIQPGQTFELAADDPRPEIWLALGHVEALPPPPAAPKAHVKPSAAPIKTPE
jgi:hypothetical protein